MITTGNKQEQEINAIIEKHKLTLEFKFVPFSQSRYKDEKHPSLNWTYTLKRDGREVLSGDYTQGWGHAPASKVAITNNAHIKRRAIAEQCEIGKELKRAYGDNWFSGEKRIPVPLARDVLYCLMLDTSVLEHTSFESWAFDFGYDTDSRSAEKIYNEGVKIALKLNAVGATALAEFRDAFQNY